MPSSLIHPGKKVPLTLSRAFEYHWNLSEPLVRTPCNRPTPNGTLESSRVKTKKLPVDTVPPTLNLRTVSSSGEVEGSSSDHGKNLAKRLTFDLTTSPVSELAKSYVLPLNCLMILCGPVHAEVHFFGVVVNTEESSSKFSLRFEGFPGCQYRTNSPGL